MLSSEFAPKSKDHLRGIGRKRAIGALALTFASTFGNAAGAFAAEAPVRPPAIVRVVESMSAATPGGESQQAPENNLAGLIIEQYDNVDKLPQVDPRDKEERREDHIQLDKDPSAAVDKPQDMDAGDFVAASTNGLQDIANVAPVNPENLIRV